MGGQPAAGRRRFGQAVRPHLGWLYSVARRLAGDPEVAQDNAHMSRSPDDRVISWCRSWTASTTTARVDAGGQRQRHHGGCGGDRPPRVTDPLQGLPEPHHHSVRHSDATHRVHPPGAPMPAGPGVVRSGPTASVAVRSNAFRTCWLGQAVGSATTRAASRNGAPGSAPPRALVGRRTRRHCHHADPACSPVAPAAHCGRSRHGGRQGEHRRHLGR